MSVKVFPSKLTIKSVDNCLFHWFHARRFKFLQIFVCMAWMFASDSGWLKPSLRFSSFDFCGQSTIQDCLVWSDNFMQNAVHETYAC